VKPVIFHGGAQEELRHAIEWYEECSPGLGVDFKNRVQASIGRIAAQPTRFGWLRDTGFRAFRLKRFPYLVIYLELEDAIWVSAVAHEKQHPNYWRPRRISS
jgi:toxin ParE1/3/4